MENKISRGVFVDINDMPKNVHKTKITGDFSTLNVEQPVELFIEVYSEEVDMMNSDRNYKLTFMKSIKDRLVKEVESNLKIVESKELDLIIAQITGEKPVNEKGE